MKKSGFKVTPWEVSGNVDYERIIREFGVEKITPAINKKIETLSGESNPLLRRGIFFAHRDLNWLLGEYEKGNKFFLYTGRGPSGQMHLGHLLPLIFTKWLQDSFDVELWIQFTDDEKFFFKKELDFDEIESNMKDNMADVIAL
mgnify:FL=1